MKKNTLLESHRQTILVGVIVLLGLFLAGNVSADWNDVSNYDATNNTITIENWFGLGSTQASYTLTSNSYGCLTNCYAEGIVVINKEHYLFENVRFKNGKGEVVPSIVGNFFIEVSTD